jgi:hypothetical protein
MNNLNSHIKKIISNLLNENRLEKLRLQKFPQELIDKVIQFSKKTVKNPEDENLVQQNQYIPWFASELKKDENLADDEKIKVVINWIKKSNFPKFSSNMPFDKVYETAINWFLQKNIDPITLKEISGGKEVINYPDGSKWILVKDKNFCMRVGDTRGWCFSEVKRAGEFVGSKGGYILVDKDGSAKLAVQFDKNTKELIDWQGAFNKVPDKNLALKSADLISKLGEILNINSGYAHTFKQAIEKYPDFKKWISSLNNIKITPLNRFLIGLEMTPEQIHSIPTEEKLKHKIPLSVEEIKNLHPDLKLKNKIPLTDEEIKNLSPLAKLAHGYKIKSTDIKLLPNLMQKIILVMKGKDPQEVFTRDDFGNNQMYHSFEADSKKIKLNVGENYWDYSGLSDDDMSVFSNVDNYMDDANSSEDEKYMSYKILGKENEELLKELSELLGKPINEEDSNGVWEFIDENLSNSERIKDIYLTEIYEYKAKQFAEQRDKIINKEQRFKLDYITDILTLPLTKLLRFIAETNFKSQDAIKTFNDLKDSDINGVPGGYGLNDLWYNIWPKPKDVSYMQEKIKDLLEEDLEEFRENPQLIKNSEDANYILQKLGFIDRKGNKDSVNMPGGGRIAVEKINMEEGKFEVIFYTNQGTRKGYIPFEKLADYVTMESLFENKIRNMVKKVLEEDFRYLYDTNTFTPTREVIQTAQNALQVVNQNKLVQSDASNEGSGLRKAQSLVSAEPMTHAQLKRMKSFFDNNAQAVQNERNAGKNINNSPIIQKWELWGGDAGKNWAEKEINSTQSSNKTSKKVRNSDMIARDNRIMNPNNTRIHR